MDWKGITHDYNLRPRTSRERPIVQSRTVDGAGSSQNQELPEQQNRNTDDELMIVPDRELLARITNEVLSASSSSSSSSSSDESEDESNGPRPRYMRYKCKRCRKKRAHFLRKSRSGLRSSTSTAKKTTAEGSLDDIKCVICLDTVQARRMKYIPCGHGFHRKCCNNWLKINNNCPVCRAVIGHYLRIPGTNPSRPDLYETTPISDIIFFFNLSVMSR